MSSDKVIRDECTQCGYLLSVDYLKRDSGNRLVCKSTLQCSRRRNSTKPYRHGIPTRRLNIDRWIRNEKGQITGGLTGNWWRET